MNRKNALWLCTLLLAGWGCEEDKETVVESGFEVTVAACLGSAPESTDVKGCRATVDASVQSACFVMSDADGHSKSLPLGWRDGRLQLDNGDGNFDFKPGQPYSAAVFLMEKAVDASTCAGFAVDAACTGDCLLKLYQEPKVISPDGAEKKTVFNFTDSEGKCVQSWKEGRAPQELCNGVDDDCNGETDEGFEDLGLACRSGIGECARTGVIQCNAAGDATECSAQQGEAATELCDGIDNDCDGLVDEGLEGCCTAGQTMPCGVERGICTVGVQTCVVSQGATAGYFGDCKAADGSDIILPGTVPEKCDGLDNDCDGQIDNGITGLGGECTAGVGACVAVGTYVCASNGELVCNVQPGQPSTEICDGIDNDCDGVVDNGFALGQACVSGLGECVRQGVTVCQEGSMACSATSAAPGVELCNGLDDDCDGETDEDFANVGQSCGVIGLGACAVESIYACNAAMTGVECVPQGVQASPSPEICDHIDNNCDGVVDDGFVDDQGRYVTLQNCGECGVVCSHANAQSSCSTGVCTMLACDEGFFDMDGLSENGCECQLSGSDTPDLEFVDSNCDGIDGDIEAAIFVSPMGDDDAFGSQSAPFKTLARAFRAAKATGRTEIYLSTGFFDVLQGLDAAQATAVEVNPGLMVPDGVSIYGGYNPDNWNRTLKSEQARTVIGGSSVVLRYQDLESDVLMQNLVVQSTQAMVAGSSSVAVVAVDVGDHLTLEAVDLVAGNGSNGLDGIAGGDAAQSAGAGENGYASDLPISAGQGGLAGMNSACSAAGTAGQNGVNLFEATGGGGDDTPSANGSDGEDGVAASSFGLVANGLWAAATGTDATDGQPGAGGLGGQGGLLIAGEWTAAYTDEIPIVGGGGGGGGAGACGGQGAKAAQGGGGSFALSLYGGTVHLVQSTLTAGQPGMGGLAASGGRGGQGAAGGLGGSGIADVSLAGESGQAGGDGGNGGNVPAGPNGQAAAVLLISDAGATSTLEGLDTATSLCCELESGACQSLLCAD